MSNNNINTKVIHGGIAEDETTGAVSIPIYQATTFRQVELGKTKAGYEYGRSGNPTRKALESLIADLEEGAAGFAFASGLAALTTVLFLFKSGDKILTSQNVYGGTFRILDKIFKNFGVSYEIVDTANLMILEETFKKDKNIKGLIIESPANPLLTITDIKGAAEIAKKYNALTIVDNTFLTPYLQKPLTLGADIVIHSATKYLGGHSDVIAGLAVTKDPTLAERIGFFQNAAGSILEPFDSWLLIRGIKTLAVRLDRHLENAAAVAEFLKNNKAVKEIYYPGLKDFNGYEINKKQSKGAGAIISFILSDNYDYKIFFKNLKTIALAESLGGVESLACHPASMTHASIPKEIREKIGITDNLIRLSVGIEDKNDIIADLEQAINPAGKR
ncbi:trans-sulfuration enzyme family protein [Endomicrobium proavitum]|uniref:Cystathionine beta-lyase n=1 Tax=Endomicrobium proavitum TaxID=1408281 RepID=A0A0G3WIE6_9BACT|nr:PLP-dependent aspartate aminotransferase family protein [Endomicrobium proavitum]AKL98068.1 Cystathionine beta-lyase [Endomicrobium proavitum]